MHTPRWSELSFQCSGEALYANESVWVGDPMGNISPINSNILDGRGDPLPERVES